MMAFGKIITHIRKLDRPRIFIFSLDDPFHHLHPRLFWILQRDVMCSKINELYRTFTIS